MTIVVHSESLSIGKSGGWVRESGESSGDSSAAQVAPINVARRSSNSKHDEPNLCWTRLCDDSEVWDDVGEVHTPECQALQTERPAGWRLLLWGEREVDRLSSKFLNLLSGYRRLPDSCLDRYTFKESLYVMQVLQAYAFEYDVMLYMRIYVTVQDAKLCSREDHNISDTHLLQHWTAGTCRAVCCLWVPVLLLTF